MIKYKRGYYIITDSNNEKHIVYYNKAIFASRYTNDNLKIIWSNKYKEDIIFTNYIDEIQAFLFDAIKIDYTPKKGYTIDDYLIENYPEYLL